MRRGVRQRISAPVAGAIFAAVVVVFCLFAFTRANPFAHQYTLKATFQNAVNIRPDSPVRVAGVQVGRVTKVEPAGPGSPATTLTMELTGAAPAVRKDATLKIRPRIFLEGNFFVDLQPGSPSAPGLKSGGTIGIAQTDDPVQFDQVLTALQKRSRANLQTLVEGYGSALYGQPAKGERASQALNRSLRYTPGALKGTAVVSQSLLGEKPDDLSRLIGGFQRTSAKLASRDQALADLITNFNTTTAALASEQGNLRQTIALLPGVLQRANPAFDALNRAFPPTRAFAREVLPGVRETGPTIDAAFPWVDQTRALVSPPELQGLVRDLRPAVANLSTVVQDALPLLPQLDLVDRCALDVVLPTGNVKLNDPPLSTGIENFKEFWQALVGLSGESQNEDGNGTYARFQTGGGTNTLSTGLSGTGPQGGTGPAMVGNFPLQPIGTRPARPAAKPPFNRTKACFTNTPPDVQSPAAGSGP
jgi:phospholipid/cholesterol/gamma-HCH transport system substrate-binding protein